MRCNNGVRSVVRWCALAALAMLAACGGGSSGGGGTSTSTATAPPAPVVLSNFTTLTVDTGPAALTRGKDGYLADDVAFVSVTVCVPGTTTCQTIDHVTVDTGSIGLRIERSVLSSAMLAALPQQIDASNNPVGECYGFVDGYAFGSVRTADFQIGGESVSAMPFQVIGDTGQFAQAPTQCSSGGGSSLGTVQAFGANGVLGIGVTPTDCGTNCTLAGGYAAAIYYDCPAAGCVRIITRAASTAAPFQQLPNPVAAMGVDNNGTVITLPAVPASGAASLTGTLYFGIGTQTNNGLGGATALTTSTSASKSGPGLLTVLYNGKTLTDSFIDSGSNAYFFVDAAIPLCSDTNLNSFYCPPAALALDPVAQGTNGATAHATFTLLNAATLFNTNYAALPGIGANPDAISSFTSYPNSFTLGLPFFYGRTVFTAIEGRAAAGIAGPFIAF